MVDLHGQYLKIKDEIDEAIQSVIDTSSFIQGPSISRFSNSLQHFLGVKHVIPCGNGTDALQIALMSLDIEKGSEIIIPSFSFVAPAEAVALLGYIPVFADADPETFNISAGSVEKLITKRTRAIIPVHLFGQAADMEGICSLAKKYNLFVIEDNAQSLGVSCMVSKQSGLAGTLGDIGTTSFFPSKNLGAMGDGGALFTNNDDLAHKASMIANHGQKTKYFHQIIGINSRLDSIQAAVLNVKLKYLPDYNSARKKAAHAFNQILGKKEFIAIPGSNPGKDHVFNQYTIKVPEEARNVLREYLTRQGIPTMIYYPTPLHLQSVFKYLTYQKGDLPVCEKLCRQVLSLPMHTELQEDQLAYIGSNVAKSMESLRINKVLS